MKALYLYMKKFLYILLSLFFSAGIIISNTILYRIMYFIFEATGSSAVEWLISNDDYNRFDIFINIILITVLMSVYTRVYKNQEKPEVRWSPKKGITYGILAGTGFGGVPFLWIFFAQTALSGIEFIRKSLEGMDSSVEEYSKGAAILLILAAGILGPITEELLFRGVVFDFLEKVKKGWFPVVFSAIFFGLAHMQPVQIVYTTIMGLIAGTIYLKTRNIWWPIIMHITINIFATLSSFEFAKDYIGIWEIFTVIMMLPMFYIVYKLISRKEKNIIKEKLPCEG